MIVAVGRYYRDESTNYADCAFMVRDDWQGRGTGRFLVNRLIEVARSNDIAGFTADVLMQNTRMMHVFHECAPAPIKSRMEGTNYHIEFPLVPKPETDHDAND